MLCNDLISDGASPIPGGKVYGEYSIFYLYVCVTTTITTTSTNILKGEKKKKHRVYDNITTGTDAAAHRPRTPPPPPPTHCVYKCSYVGTKEICCVQARSVHVIFICCTRRGCGRPRGND